MRMSSVCVPLRTGYFMRFAAAVLCYVAMSSSVFAAERRVALVIGNASYADKPLRNPVNDAADLAAALKRIGFEVMERKNRTADQLRGDLSDFQDKLSPGAVGLFYFAGHGVQAGRGQNYLLPVGVTYKRERDAEAYGLEVGSVLRRMEDSGASLSLVILDACRDSPLPAEGRSTASRGLSRMEAPSGSMIAFATAPGSIADDNSTGRNGLYTQHLLGAIETPGMRLEDVFKRVRRGVEKDSNRRQSPEEIMKLTSDEPFYFKGAPGVQTASVRPEPTGRLPQGDPEEDAWAATKAANTVGGYDAYLSEYPKGRYAGAARVARTALQATPIQQPAPTQTAQQRLASNSTNSNTLSGGQVFKDCADCPEMVLIPAGSFQMGGKEEDEQPVHRVKLQSFAMGKTEVTQAQWKAVMGSNPSYFPQCGSNCPIEQVNWDDTQQFIQKLNQKAGKQYRLPSEAEWEYACRAGANQTYCGSDNLDAVAVYGGNGGKSPLPVGGKQANAWGLFDMSGNVWEWTQDCWIYHYIGATTDGSAWTTGNCVQRVLRGGSWAEPAANARAAVRLRNITSERFNFDVSFGFRLARALP